MGALLIETGKINSYVFPYLDKAISDIDYAYQDGINLKKYLTDSLAYSQIFNDVSSKLHDIKTGIADTKKDINLRLSMVEQIESKKTDSFYSLLSKIGLSSLSVIGMTTPDTKEAKIQVSDENSLNKEKGTTGAEIFTNVACGLVELGEGFLDFGKAVIDWGTDIYESVCNFFQEKVAPKINTFCEAFNDFLVGLGNGFIATCATLGNVVVGLTEGLVKLVDVIGDLGLVLIGGLGSFVTLTYDLIVGGLDSDFGMTDYWWSETIMPLINNNWSEDLYDTLYECTPLATMNEYALGPFKRDNLGYSICEGIGYYGGMIILSIISGGSTAAAASGGTASTTSWASLTELASTKITSGIFSGFSYQTLSYASITGLTSFSSNVQSGYDSWIKNIDNMGTSFFKDGFITVMETSFGKSIIDSGYSLAMSGLGDYMNKLKNVSTNSQMLNNVAQYMYKYQTPLKSLFRSTKAYMSEFSNSIITGEDYDFGRASYEFTKMFLADLTVSGVTSALSMPGNLSNQQVSSNSQISTSQSIPVIQNVNTPLVTQLNHIVGSSTSTIKDSIVKTSATYSNLLNDKVLNTVNTQAIKGVESEIFDFLVEQVT